MQLSCCKKLSWLIVFCCVAEFWKTLQSYLKKLSKIKLIVFLKIIIQKWIYTTVFSFNLLNLYHIYSLSFSIAALLILSFVISWLSNCRYRDRLLSLNSLESDNLSWKYWIMTDEMCVDVRIFIVLFCILFCNLHIFLLNQTFCCFMSCCWLLKFWCIWSNHSDDSWLSEVSFIWCLSECCWFIMH